MNGTFFYIDFTAFALVLLLALPFFVLWRWRSGFLDPFIFYSNVDSLKADAGRVRWKLLPVRLFFGGLFAFALAFIDPHLLLQKIPETHVQNPVSQATEGIAIYLILDQSGSMKENVFAETSRGLQQVSKIDLVRQVTKDFILGDPALGLHGRPSDLLGLVYFARAARVMSPLTLDHQVILEALAQYKPVADPDQDGTSLGYAIFKTANLMAATRHYAQELRAKGQPAYLIKSNVIILLTDGLQDPNPLDKGKRLRNIDVPEAAAYAKEQGVRLYIVNVDPKLATEEFIPYQHIMQRAAELTGGKFYMLDKAGNLQKIYHDIDQLEKSALPEPQGLFQREKRPDLYRRISFYPFLIMLGLACLLAAFILETCVWRRVP